MSPGKVRAELVAERVAWIRQMLEGIRALPLESRAAFEADRRNSAAAESYLRRALEALLDIGRHVLAKGFGRAAREYKEIADVLVEVGVLDEDRGRLLREMAGYRNRLVHFYDRVGIEELHEICAERLGDIDRVLEALLAWIRSDPGRTDAPD